MAVTTPIETADSVAALPQVAPQSGFRRTFSALYVYPAFRRLWFAAFAASLGQWMQSIALGWLALELTDSKSFVGVVAFSAGLPFLIVSVPAGMLIDRFDRRKVLMTAQALAAFLAVLVAIDVVVGWVQPWHLLMAGFLNGSLQAILNPTQQSLVPRLVARGDLTNAIGLLSSGGNMTRVVGPSLAGVLIGIAGTGEAFLVQAATLVLALGLIATARFPNSPAAISAAGFRSVWSGFGIVASRPDLRAVFLLATIPTFFVFPYISFLPVYARDILDIGAAGLGLLLATSGAGAVAGSLLVAAANRGHGIGRGIVVRTLMYCGVIAGFAVSSTLFISLPLLVFAGLLGANFMSANNVLIQHRITDDIRGRVMGTYMLTFGLMPMGALPMGLIADHIGIQATTAAGAFLGMTLTGLLAFRARLLFEL